MKNAISLNAGNDRNGNPRRVFVVFDEAGTLIDTIDEGYRGNSLLKSKYGISSNATFDTTPKQYRELIRDNKD